MGYSIGLRAGDRGLIARWQDVEGGGSSRRVFCGWRRVEFAKGFPQIGVGVELSTPSIVLESIRLRVTGRALLSLVTRDECVDCIRPLFSGVDYASSFDAVPSYSS